MTKAMSRPRYLLVPAGVLAGLLFTGQALGSGAQISPAVSLAGTIQLYSLVVPPGAAPTTLVSLEPPAGFVLSSFVPAPGWRRQLSVDTGQEGAIEQIVWRGGPSRSGEAMLFQFLGEPSRSGSFSFDVVQRFANGTELRWDGPPGSRSAAPTIDARPSLGQSDRPPVLTWVALVVAGVGVLLGATALFARGH